MIDREKVPTLTDYLAGAIIASGSVWIWSQATPYLLWIPLTQFIGVSFIIHISAGTLASYLVCKRASSRHFFVGIKLAAVAWVFSILMLLLITVPSTTFLTILLAGFMIGGVAGAYLASKRV